MKKNIAHPSDNVSTFNKAINYNYHPSSYSYQKDDIPIGEYYVTLDFMIWANKVSGIDLFCTILQTDQRIRLTVFRDKEENYCLHGVDVRQLSYGSGLAIQVELNGRDKPTLHKITVLPDISAGQAELKI